MIRQVKIEAVLNGFIVEVGCQRVVFVGKEVMLDAIRDWGEE